ncbi:hypothetical protein D3C87_1248340 [compost metagenome]
MRYTSGRAAIEAHAGHAQQWIEQAFTQAHDQGFFFVERSRGQGEGRAHGGNLVGRQGAGAQATFVSATVDLCQQTRPRPRANVQRADALGAVELVRRKRH